MKQSVKIYSFSIIFILFISLGTLGVQRTFAVTNDTLASDSIKHDDLQATKKTSSDKLTIFSTNYIAENNTSTTNTSENKTNTGIIGGVILVGLAAIYSIYQNIKRRKK